MEGGMSHKRQVLGPVEFPSPFVPEDPRHLHLLGLYAMREKGLFMHRIKILGGRITTEQWRRLAQLATTFTPEYPIHVTTRQDIELHGVPSAALPQVQVAIAQAGLTTLGACGDCPRNITVCPSGGLCAGRFDLLPLARSVDEFLRGLPDIHALPRKFKISFSGCREQCAQPWINDLGFVATSQGVFDVIGAGSLGFKPGTGVVLARGIGTADVFACVLAAIRIFQRLGDRAHRMRARWRHVRERLGNEAFHRLFDEEFAKARSDGRFPAAEVPAAVEGVVSVARLAPPLGDLTPAQAGRLADLCEAHSAWTTIDNQHGVRIYGRSAEPLRQTLERDALLSETLTPVSIVACPGATWCTKGIADSRAMAGRLREVAARVKNGQSVTICISGCPNQCAQSGVAAIGLVGLVRTINNTRTECFRVLAGGGQGKSPELARELAPALPSQEVPRLVEELLENWPSFISI
jgi:sulfite reductase (NADPH) hemoprotein beta-component